MGSMEADLANLNKQEKAAPLYDETEEANEMRRLTQKVDDSLHFLEVIHRTPIDAYKKEAALHKGKLAKARDTALSVGEQICTLRERAYYLARERQARLQQQARLKRSLVKSIELVNE